MSSSFDEIPLGPAELLAGGVVERREVQRAPHELLSLPRDHAEHHRLAMHTLELASVDPLELLAKALQQGLALGHLRGRHPTMELVERPLSRQHDELALR